MTLTDKTQAETFGALACKVEAAPDEKAWDERLTKVAKHAPEMEKPE